MSVDLSKCRPGDILKMRNGGLLTLVRRMPDSRHYPYIVRYEEGGMGSRTRNGCTNKGKLTETDVVRVVPPKPKLLQKTFW